MLIALLEDDRDQRDVILAWLESGGHVAHGFGDGTGFIGQVKRERFDLLMVDWMLPDTNGGRIIHWAREQLGWKVPIIVLTSREDEQTTVSALKSGADDYLVKPVRPAVLLARIDALARRYGTVASAGKRFGAYEIDLQGGRIALEGSAIELTQKEFDLAVYLFDSPGKLLSRDHLLNRIWGLNTDVDTRTVDTHVSRLRKKLRLDGSNGWRVAPVYGYGYRFEQAQA
ncbi:response regulator transcription factor [Ralstonia solanacearum]|uniref:response regulator transcription factor n=1 Tax=Ralstonia solanacearum TaxID=305 RepID=UPI0005C73B93|nr:response regulator transcription factor [Ralstonia solanacearum]MDB0542255.1 response regulator transcription factor [Ralstonia solanacearum]MDB0552473.1 response regulator transcription factor [Ralstonia solanacearum]MDB0557219.1 response regulator transcription factor [Ralstonia solanacearum]